MGKNRLSTSSAFMKYKGLLHNLAVIACGAQLIILYFVSGLGLYQTMGGMWHEGTAIYYITQVEQYYIPSFIGNLVLSSEVLMVGHTLFSLDKTGISIYAI
ncbi:hypothetical protein [Alteribacter populi]|uniref:hypothetical protein n=1 Tax=Alteribacter populi TaxID=2011011 RepID=UPI0012FFC309|nr:hypothetical protein [Alteribacter populi]